MSNLTEPFYKRSHEKNIKNTTDSEYKVTIPYLKSIHSDYCGQCIFDKNISTGDKNGEIAQNFTDTHASCLTLLFAFNTEQITLPRIKIRPHFEGKTLCSSLV